MKKRIYLLVCLTLISSLTAGVTCGCSSKGPGRDRLPGVNDVLEQGMAEADNKKAGDPGRPAENDTQNRQDPDDPQTPATRPTPGQDTGSTPADGADEVDVDLTVLSATMVYSEVYNMMVSPESYIGKTVRMRGRFTVYHDSAANNFYFACLIQDATACCAQGIEFVLTDDHVFPDDYPEPGEEICVTGIFDTYKEGNYTYCTLRRAKLT